MYTRRSSRVKPQPRPLSGGLKRALGVVFVLLLLFASGPASAKDRYDPARAREATLARLTARFQAGAYQEVLAVFEDSLKAKDYTPRLWNLKGLVLAQLSRQREAVKAYEEGLRLEDSLFELHLNLAKSLKALGSTGRAMAELERAVRLAPDSVEARLALGTGFLDYRRYAQAREQLEEAARLAPDDLRVLRQRARLADATGHPEQSMRRWTELERTKPDADTARRLGELWTPSAPDSAIQWYERCVERDPSCHDCAAAAGSLLLKAGKPGQALPWLRRAVQAGPPSQEAVYNLLLAWQGLGKADSIEALAARNPPKFARSWGVIALTRRQEGKLSSALKAAERALALAPDDLDLANVQAVILLELGRKEEAKRIWRRILQIDPNHALAKSNLEQAG